MFFYLDNPNSIRLRTLIKNQQVDIVYIAWLIRCIEQKQRLQYFLSDLISCTEKTRQALDLLYDEYGDAYYSSTNEDELRKIFNKMSSSAAAAAAALPSTPPSPPAASPSKKLPANKKRRLNEPIPLSQSIINMNAIPNPLDDTDKLRSFISEFENTNFPDESSDFGLFRLFYIYFDQYSIIGDESTQCLDPNQSLIILESQLHGARVAHAISSDVTHVICAKVNSNDKTSTERINAFKKLNRDRATKFHLVNYDWIKASIENQRLVKELPFAV